MPTAEILLKGTLAMLGAVFGYALLFSERRAKKDGKKPEQHCCLPAVPATALTVCIRDL